MKAVVCRGNGNISYEDIPEPTIKENEVLVKVMACGICGSDIPRVMKMGAHSYPFVFGHEFSGVVHRIGDNVRGLKMGDHIVAAPLIPCHSCEQCKSGDYSLCNSYSFIGSRQQGAMADYVAVPARNVLRISSNIPYDKAVLFEPSTVALHGILISDFKPNKTVLIIGAGIIGILTLKWAKILGASMVVIVGRSEGPLQVARDSGADNTISTLSEDHLEKAMEYSENCGYDYVFDCAGTQETIPLAFKLASKKGSICYIGTPSDGFTFQANDWNLLNRKELRVLGSWMSYSAEFPGKEWELTKKAMEDGSLDVDMDSIVIKYPMNEANKAFHKLSGKERVRGRVVLVNEE